MAVVIVPFVDFGVDDVAGVEVEVHVAVAVDLCIMLEGSYCCSHWEMLSYFLGDGGHSSVYW